MGVKLKEIIPKKEIEFDDLKGKKIAIDFSNMAYQFLASIRQRDGTPLKDSKGNITSVYLGLFSRLSNLMQRNIKLAVCFDGRMPLLKIKEQESRELRKRLAETKLKKAKQEEDIESMLKYSKQTIRLTKPIVEESKELLKAMGLPAIQCPSEADAQISAICEKGDVDYAASSDYDCLLYGCPRQITNLTLSQRKRLPSGVYVKTTPEVIELKEVLNTLGIDQDRLLVIAILCGTDYNPSGIRGIGPKTALKLVKQYSSFDKLFKEVNAPFNWKEVYAVFKSMPIMKNYQLKWKKPDEKKIKNILVKKHDFSEDRVNKTLEKLNKIEKAKEQTGLKKWT